MALSTNGAEIKAEEYMALAEKALKKFSIFSSAGKFEEAGECYEKAGNQYKIAKKCTCKSRLLHGDRSHVRV